MVQTQILAGRRESLLLLVDRSDGDVNISLSETKTLEIVRFQSSSQQQSEREKTPWSLSTEEIKAAVYCWRRHQEAVHGDISVNNDLSDDDAVRSGDC